VFYKRASARARTAAKPPTATRSAALPDGEAVGKAEVDSMVVLEAAVVVALDTAVVETTTATEEVEVTTAVVVATVVVIMVDDSEAMEVEEAMEEAMEELEAAMEVAPAVGMLKVTPTPEQRPSAAWMVLAKSAAEQAAWTHGVKALMKAVAMQIHLISVSWHPEDPMEETAQVRAQDGMSESWAETTEAATRARTAETFILIIILCIKIRDLCVSW